MYKVGEKVKVIKNLSMHGLPLGSIVEIKKVESQGSIGLETKIVINTCWWVGSDEIELVSPEAKP